MTHNTTPPLPGQMGQPGPPPPPSKPGAWKKPAAIAGAVVIAFGAYVGYNIVTGADAKHEATQQAAADEKAARDASAAELQAKSSAEITCEKLVTDRLKAPATADFTGVTTYQDTVGDYITKGAVDSENSFGANLRNTFTCTTHHGVTHVDSIN
jgi:hypothetical protein